MTSYVITASVYVDDCDSPEEASAAVENLNNYVQEVNVGPRDVFIRLPDSALETNTNESHWEQSGSE